MNIAPTGPVTLRRGFRFWSLGLFLVLFWVLVLRHWSSAYLDTHYYAAKAYDAFWIGVVIFPIKMLMDIYSRFIKKDYILFDKMIIVDNISNLKLGSFKWDVVESIDLERHMFAAGVIFTFKQNAKINDAVTTPLSNLTIPSLGISDADTQRIMNYFNLSRHSDRGLTGVYGPG